MSRHAIYGEPGNEHSTITNRTSELSRSAVFTSFSKRRTTPNDGSLKTLKKYERLGSNSGRFLCLYAEGEQVIEQSICAFVLGEVRFCSRLTHRTLGVLVIVG